VFNLATKKNKVKSALKPEIRRPVLDTSDRLKKATQSWSKITAKCITDAITFLMSDSAAKKIGMTPRDKEPTAGHFNQLKHANQSQLKTYTKCIASASPISVCLNQLQKKIR
jgi:hypothetical protein